MRIGASLGVTEIYRCFVMAGDRSRDPKSQELLHCLKNICQAKKPEVSDKQKRRSVPE